jgi:hypothetical protein
MLKTADKTNASRSKRAADVLPLARGASFERLSPLRDDSLLRMRNRYA